MFGAFATNGLGRLPLVLAPNIPVRNPDGTPAIDAPNNRATTGNNFPNAVGFNWPNPLYDLETNVGRSATDRILGNFFIEARPFKGLSLRTTYGIDRLNVEDNTFRTRIHAMVSHWEQLLIRISAACYGIGKIRLLILQLLQTIII